MRLSKIGDYIELNENKNSNLELGIDDVMEMTITKEIIPTKADIKEKELPKFYVCEPFDFIYNPRTHGKRIGLGFNTLNRKFLISWNNIAFRVKKEKLSELEPYYLFIWLNRNEWDRNATFRSWGSSTEVFSWKEFCDMDIELPDIKTQRKYVAIYKAMQHNLKVYESKLNDLKLVCDGYIEDLRRNYPCEPIGKYLNRIDVKNTDNKIKNVKNVSVYKCFNEPTAKVNRDDLKNYKIVKPRQISFVQTTHNEKVFAYAINRYDTDVVVSPVNEVFETDCNNLLPEYLCMFFSRKEFDRYARFHSWGSARETFTWDDLVKVSLPIPKIGIQENIAKFFDIYYRRKQYVEILKKEISNICPILIAGAIKEAKEYA